MSQMRDAIMAAAGTSEGKWLADLIRAPRTQNERVRSAVTRKKKSKQVLQQPSNITAVVK